MQFFFRSIPLALLASVTSLFSTPADAQMTEEPSYEVEVRRGIVYTEGKIRVAGQETVRDLWLDAYFPVDAGEGALPAVIYTHGGSFHIGSPRTAYRVDGAITTSPEEYCRLFSGLGFACFAINYRLGPEEPIASEIGYENRLVERGRFATMMDRVGIIRENLGLRPLDENDPADEALVTDTVLSAAEDLWQALQFVRVNSGELGVDPDRIVLGGFSAGAVTSLNVAHGMNAPVAGVFMLSTGPIGLDIFETVTPSSNSAPALVFAGQYDLSAALVSIEGILQHYEDVGLDHEFAWVPGLGHFYPSGAPSLGADGSVRSVADRIVGFVGRVTAP